MPIERQGDSYVMTERERTLEDKINFIADRIGIPYEKVIPYLLTAQINTEVRRLEKEESSEEI